MALDKLKLKNDLFNIFKIDRETPLSSQEVSAGIEKSFLNYIKDVNLESYQAGLNPGTNPPTPDANYSSINVFKPSVSFDSAPSIRNGLIKSFELNLLNESPTWVDANKGFVEFLKSFISYKTFDMYIAIGETVPGNIELLQIFSKNTYHDSAEETATKLSDLLHKFTTDSKFKGTYKKFVYVNPESILPSALPYESKLI